MTIEARPKLPAPTDDAYMLSLVETLTRVMTANGVALKRLADGRIAGAPTAFTAAPTGGLWAQGDQVRNSAPVESGAATDKFVVIGWVCVAGGEPGTWLPMHALTGN